MKKFLSFGLALIVLLSFPVSSYAFGESKETVISFDEYIQALKREYENYNISLKVLEYNESYVYTQELLDGQIAQLNNYMETVEFDSDMGCFITYATPVFHMEMNLPGPMSLPHTRNYYYASTVHAPGTLYPGSAELRIQVNTTEDVQSGNFMSVNSVISYQYGYAVNFDSWTHMSHTANIANYLNPSQVYGSVLGRLVCSLIEPKTRMRLTSTSDHNVYYDIDCGS